MLNKTNIKVCARIRPLLPQEILNECSIVLAANRDKNEVYKILIKIDYCW